MQRGCACTCNTSAQARLFPPTCLSQAEVILSKSEPPPLLYPALDGPANVKQAVASGKLPAAAQRCATWETNLQRALAEG